MISNSKVAQGRTVLALRWLSTAVALAVLAACTTKPSPRAPVVDRTAQPRSAVTGQPPAAAMPGAENAGKPGYHTVKAGETLTRIAIQYGQDRRNIEAWNQLTNPDLIEVGQVLRIVPPVVSVTAVPSGAGGTASSPVASNLPSARPLPAPGAAQAPVASVAPVAAAASPVAVDGVQLAWPAQGDVLSKFDEKTSRGIAISGRLGDPVLAAADGVVAIAGSPIRGLGNLVIIQHAGGVITAYAHNQALLVKEDQQVKQGQRIAEMGSSDTDRVKLHFEVRRQGKPVDPMTFLPKR